MIGLWRFPLAFVAAAGMLTAAANGWPFEQDCVEKEGDRLQCPLGERWHVLFETPQPYYGGEFYGGGRVVDVKTAGRVIVVDTYFPGLLEWYAERDPRVADVYPVSTEKIVKAA